jgi:hypothetical protein
VELELELPDSGDSRLRRGVHRIGHYVVPLERKRIPLPAIAPLTVALRFLALAATQSVLLLRLTALREITSLWARRPQRFNRQIGLYDVNRGGSRRDKRGRAHHARACN